ARLTLENVLDAASLGAAVATGLAVESLTRGAGGRVDSLTARDRESGRSITVRARAFVNAAGPWGDRVRRLAEAGAAEMLRLSRGPHLAVPRERLALGEIVAFPMPDGRLLFAVPHGAVTVLGTTDTDFTGSPDEVHAGPEDVAYLLDAARRTFPAAGLAAAGILLTFAGPPPPARNAGPRLRDTTP